MLLIIGLLIGVLLLLWPFNGVLIALGWAFKAVYYLCVALCVTTLALAKGGAWSYRRAAATSPTGLTAGSGPAFND